MTAEREVVAMARIAAVVVALAVLVLPAGAAVLPELPETAPIVALAAPDARDCNAATAFLAAQAAYRTELTKPAAERKPLTLQDEAMKLILQGIECRRCEFPYSGDLAIPPGNQEIPPSSLFWAASRSLVEEGARLRQQKHEAEAAYAYAQTARLGVLILEDPGMTYIQQLIGLRILTEAAEGLGDLAVAQGDPERAATCARFIASSRAYREGLGRFLREELRSQALLEDADAQAAHVREVAALFASTENRAIQVEILMYLGLARPLLKDEGARAAVEATLAQAARHPDRRLGKLAAWCRTVTAESARSAIHASASWPLL
jgi:hypothetical protein